MDYRAAFYQMAERETELIDKLSKCQVDCQDQSFAIWQLHRELKNYVNFWWIPIAFGAGWFCCFLLFLFLFGG